MAIITKEDMEHLFGEAGIDLRSSDKDGEAMIAKAIRWAENQVKSRLLKRFPLTQIEASTWVQDHCITLACYRLSITLGNPSQYTEEKDEALLELDKAVSGEIVIPDATELDDFRPGFGNTKVDNRYTISKERVLRPISSKDTHANQHEYRHNPTHGIDEL